jgi:ApaG protein
MPLPPRSVSTTQGIRVTASAFYVPEESNPEEGQYKFGYLIHLANEGTQPAKLLSRHWIIIDAEGERREVKGLGVVGEHPSLKPGEEFKYTSTVPLPTNWGTMEGTYEMERPDGTTFQAKISRFYLAIPAPMPASTNA